MVLFFVGFTECTAGEPRQLVPQPQLGSVIGAPRHCTGTRIADEEVLTSASCVAGARPADLQFVAQSGNAALPVRWVIAGQDLDSPGFDDWAILALEDATPARDVGARHLRQRFPQLVVGAPLWWAAVSAGGNRINSGLCRIRGLVQVAQDLDYQVVRHDCEGVGSAPGVLLYDLDEQAPRAIAFQGNGELAVTVDAFSDVPVPAQDLLVTHETFVGAKMTTVYALDPHGRVSRRRNVEGTWLHWTNVALLPQPGVRIDGVARSHDLLGLELDHVWVLNETGQVFTYSFSGESLHAVEGIDENQSSAFVDLAAASTPDEQSSVFAVTREGTLCARPNTTRQTTWVCTGVGMGALALDTTHMAGGHLAVVARDHALTAVAFIDGAWQAPLELAADGGHRQVTVSTTARGTLYVVTTQFDRMRVRVGDFEANAWSEWAPLHTVNLSEAVTVLNSGRDHFEHEVVYAVAGGEVLTSRELIHSSLDTWLTQPERPPEFGPWQRLRGVNSVRR